MEALEKSGTSENCEVSHKFQQGVAIDAVLLQLFAQYLDKKIKEVSQEILKYNFGFMSPKHICENNSKK